MNNPHETLVAKVKARNKVHKVALELSPAMYKALEPFVGQKVCKVGGDLFNKVKKALPTLPSTVALQGWYSTGHGYSLTANLKVCESIPPYGCCYAEASVYLANLRDGVLTELFPNPPTPENWPTNYTVEEVYAVRKELEAAEKAVSELNSKIHHFGKYD